MTTGSLEAGDAAAAAVAKTDRRVTLAAMEAKVEHVQYFHPDIAPELTICVMKLTNGFVLVGKSAPADPANFNQELGRKFAREDCIRQMWPLEGYLLREQLSEPSHHDGEAYIAGDQIRVGVNIANLPKIIEANPAWSDEFVVSDVGEAARSIVRRLNDEEEDGTTLIHRAFDKAAETALEQGDDGFDEQANEED
ncbi:MULTISPECIES: Gp49 family protein [unclassified Mesorhizobium]|uniref:Gp49 family protein n=1 Tax=unclassified Mesorhizobium TaxID=325217 RepID=UPI001091E3D1|nr:MULTISPECIES: Gp49 family protein [unclassified Mesorhizobium]TGP93828.1 hypothetical protein EN861_17215 [Mesorhizobium sp. M8A.F.Ca.ET.218.01.1.1]TGT18125.1 hypothetical protein EN856_16745 [Mesorhizobium sp. M8A.F.Ca.ET.213.01.1.1]